jgi:hypothetical protein
MVLFTGHVKSAHVLQGIEVECRHAATERLYHDLRVALELLKEKDAQSESYRKLFDTVDKVTTMLDFRLDKKLSSDSRGLYKSVNDALKLLEVYPLTLDLVIFRLLLCWGTPILTQHGCGQFVRQGTRQFGRSPQCVA